MVDMKDYPNRRVLSQEEVEAVAGGAIGTREELYGSVQGAGRSVNEAKKHRCPKCGKLFATKAQLDAHLLICNTVK